MATDHQNGEAIHGVPCPGKTRAPCRTLKDNARYEPLSRMFRIVLGKNQHHTQPNKLWNDPPRSLLILWTADRTRTMLTEKFLERANTCSYRSIQNMATELGMVRHKDLKIFLQWHGGMLSTQHTTRSIVHQQQGKKLFWLMSKSYFDFLTREAVVPAA